MKRIRECANPDCKKTFESLHYRKYCCKKCNSHNNYLKHKEQITARNKRWCENNPEKSKAYHKKAFNKFYNEKRPRFLELMRNQYKTHKLEWDCRARTRYFITKNKIHIEPKCKLCGTTKELSRKFEEFGLKKEKIEQLIENGKIYNICNNCRIIQKVKLKNNNKC